MAVDVPNLVVCVPVLSHPPAIALPAVYTAFGSQLLSLPTVSSCVKWVVSGKDVRKVVFGYGTTWHQERSILRPRRLRPRRHRAAAEPEDHERDHHRPRASPRKGMKLVVATGRRFEDAREYAGRLGFAGGDPVICYGGSMVRRIDGETLLHRTLPTELGVEVL